MSRKDCHKEKAFWAFIFRHFGLLGFHFRVILAFWAFIFLSFQPFGHSFPFILAFWAFIFLILVSWAFISFQFGLVGIHFLPFLPAGPTFFSF